MYFSSPLIFPYFSYTKRTRTASCPVRPSDPVRWEGSARFASLSRWIFNWICQSNPNRELGQKKLLLNSPRALVIKNIFHLSSIHSISYNISSRIIATALFIISSLLWLFIYSISILTFIFISVHFHSKGNRLMVNRGFLLSFIN